ncbi:gliding motility protein [Shivajiella indica]|uniref:Gliding motility protein n=1 Tax=Shivajiella indica TaxID=872115 RepID=A0ABW5B2I0_9BACT
MRPILFRLFIIATLFTACSSEKNTFTNRVFHNTTSRYNAVFYSQQILDEIEDAIEKDHREDYSQVLPIFFPIDSGLIDQNADKLKDIREFASKAIEWHKISKWVDDSYFFLGMADYYEAKFDDASNTFRYLNVNSKKKRVRHKSLIQLMRQFTDLNNYDDAAYVIDYLSKETGINKENRYHLYKNLAYYYDKRGDVNGKIGALDRALELTKDKKEKSRINFILAQLYQREGLDNLAYSYYNESLKGNPPYERSFFAQLFAQQVAELNKSRDVKRVRDYYDNLYKDSKNLDLRDVILYEKALFELKMDDVEEAENLLIRAAKEEGRNPLQKGYIYQKLAEISYEIKKDFRSTKYYLDSALANIRPTDVIYAEVNEKKGIFDSYVIHFETISKNDSLIRLAQMSPEEQGLVAEMFIKQEEQRLIREAEEKAMPKSTGIFDNLLAFGGRGSGESFYFDNSVAMQQGSIDFYRNWGSRPLDDNWRRNVQGFQADRGTTTSDSEDVSDMDQSQLENENPLLGQIPDIESLLAQIPKTEKEINALKLGLEESYFELGKLLFFDFKEPEISIEYLESLITTYPNSNKKAEAYYILFLANEEINGNANLYAQRLNREFPESPFTYSVNNPDAVKGNQAFLESSRKYKEAYEQYYAGNYSDSRNLIRSTLESYPLTKNTDRLLLLDIMVSGKIDDQDRYKSRLENYIQTTENPELVKMARNMLLALTGEKGQDLDQTETISKEETVEEEKVEEIEEEIKSEEDSPYRENPDQTHIFVISLSADKAKESKNLLADLETFHMQNFASARLRTGNMNLNREEVIFIVSPFSNAEKALSYRDKFMNDFNSNSLEPSDKENCFLISIGNFQELNRRKNLNEYRQFYRSVYQ